MQQWRSAPELPKISVMAMMSDRVSVVAVVASSRHTCTTYVWPGTSAPLQLHQVANEQVLRLAVTDKQAERKAVSCRHQFCSTAGVQAPQQGRPLMCHRGLRHSSPDPAPRLTRPQLRPRSGSRPSARSFASPAWSHNSSHGVLSAQQAFDSSDARSGNRVAESQASTAMPACQQTVANART